MGLFNKFRGGPVISSTALRRQADAISLRQVEGAVVQARPTEIGVAYVEQEFDCLADQQRLAWLGEGVRAARPFRVRARGLAYQAAASAFLLAESAEELRQARTHHQHAVRAVGHLVRREPGAKLRYWIIWPLIICSDVAGVSAAAISYGEHPLIAVGQAAGAGLAAGCAGLVGKEIKDTRMARARQRDPASLNEDERPFAHLFRATATGWRLIGLLSAMVVGVLSVGIFILRASVEGSAAAGLTFGLLAAATALASLLINYASADAVADLLASYDKRARRAQRRYQQLATSTAPREKAEAEETARAIEEEHLLRGQAAARFVSSLSWLVMRNHPEIFGHGFPAGEQGGVIGRRTRRGGAA